MFAIIASSLHDPSLHNNHVSSFAVLQHYPNWEVFLDVKRITHYCKHALPRNAPVSQPQSRITVKVRFSAWRMNVDTAGVRQAVEEVMNKTGDFQ